MCIRRYICYGVWMAEQMCSNSLCFENHSVVNVYYSMGFDIMIHGALGYYP